jgi:hypothetical protein
MYPGRPGNFDPGPNIGALRALRSDPCEQAYPTDTVKTDAVAVEAG